MQKKIAKLHQKAASVSIDILIHYPNSQLVSAQSHALSLYAINNFHLKYAQLLYTLLQVTTFACLIAFESF